MTKGELIKRIRLEYGEEQKDFCKRFSVSHSTISWWESDRRNPRFPHLKMLVELAKKVGLKIKFEDFINENSKNTK